jgi:hypothetical protein
VGTLKLVQQPASLDVANQVILPPTMQVQFSRQVAVDNHQLQTLAHTFNNDSEFVQEELTRFGEALRSRLQEQPFTWQGVGRLELEGAYIHFEPQQPSVALLEPVPAHRVLRENVQHTVLVGEQERQISAEDYQPTLDEPQRRRSWVIILGWIAVLLAIAFIVYHLYIGGFKPSATGMRQKPLIQQAPRQYTE